MKCPHCLNGIHEGWANAAGLGDDAEGSNWLLQQLTCPECKRLILRLGGVVDGNMKWDIIHPRASGRVPLPPDVPQPYASDYKEACLVLGDSPKASAALSRRCLQHVLREKAKVKHGNLSAEIDEAMTTLPSHLGEAIDAVRIVGNFAAHPMKNTNTGEVLDVEEGEAEWLLDVLEGLFDFYFVQPEVLARKKVELNQKLQDAGKPPMK